MEEAKELHHEYLEMKRRGEEELPVSERFEVFKRRGSLTHQCENLLDTLDTPFEEPLADEVELMRGRISFLKEKVEGERSLEGLERLRSLVESEEREVRALLDKNRELFEERRKRETEEKRKWIIRRRMDRLGVSEEEARRSLQEREALFEDGLEGIYKIEREMERSEKVRNECLRYMGAADYNRLSMLFLESLPNAEYLINFWREERDILARYGEVGWRELVRFYGTHRDSLVSERPPLKKAFLTHLSKIGLQACPYCNLLMSMVGLPPQFQCPRCGVLLRAAAIPGAMWG